MSKGFGGAGGGMGNVQEMMKQAQKMQEKLQQVAQEAESFVVEGAAGGGTVKVSMNGKHQVLAVSIFPEAVNPADVEMLQDLVVVATNDAVEKVKLHMKNEMGKVTGGISIPGLF